LLTLRLVDPIGGEAVATFEKRGRREELPHAAVELADEVRKRVGDPDLRAGSLPPLERATTASLEALRTFSAGMKAVNGRQWATAATLMEEAVRCDPDFALAHIYAAHVYANIHDNARALPHFEAALALAPGVSDRERLFITGSYFERVQHQYRKAMTAYEALLRLYPDDYWATNNLMVTTHQLGLVDQEMDARKRLLELRPESAQATDAGRRFASGNLSILWWHYRRTRPDHSQAERYGQMLRRLVAEPGPGDYMRAVFDLEAAADAWWSGDVKVSAAEVDRVTAQALARSESQTHYLLPVAMGNTLLGKIAVARRLCERMTGFRDRDECLLRVAYSAGDANSIRELLEKIRVHEPLAYGLESDDAIALMAGDKANVERWFEQKLADGYENGKNDFHGLLLLVQGYPSEGGQELRKAIRPNGPQGMFFVTFFQHLGLAMTLDKQGKLDEAISQLEPDTRPALAQFEHGWPWVQCRLKLVELYRKKGQPEEAARVEAEIRLYLSTGDSDHPVLARLQNAVSAVHH
jgi:hypothetical protein